jgi:ATP synthase protein I
MATDETNQAPDGGEDPRLTSLEDRLRNAQTAEDKRTEPLKVRNIFTGKGSSQGNRVLSAIVGAPLGGLFVGFALDQVFGTRPWVMLGMMFLGIVAGFVQVWRISQESAE